jgi:hypothetical protein
MMEELLPNLHQYVTKTFPELEEPEAVFGLVGQVVTEEELLKNARELLPGRSDEELKGIFRAWALDRPDTMLAELFRPSSD